MARNSATSAMLLNTIRRYWATVCGGVAVTGFVIMSILWLGSASVGELVEAEMRARGANFVRLLLGPQGQVDAFLTGIARDPNAETTIRTVANLADIESFAVFSQQGEEVFRSRSDRYEWLLRDRPGGISSGDRLSPSLLERQGEWQVVHDEGRTNSSVVAPLIRDGVTIGYLSVVANMDESRAAYAGTLGRTSALVAFVLCLATGVPFLLYLRRKRKISEADERIQFLANHDGLTHLLNRRRMQEETDRVMATARATRERVAYLYIDLDELSEINNSLGHGCGDELLRTVATRLAAAVDEGDLVARIGADDFAVLHRRSSDVAAIASFARRISDSVCEPVQLGGQTVRPSISIGCALAPQDGRIHSEIVKHAEIAHLHHKADKGRSLVFFDPSMDDEMARRRQIEALVREAVEKDRFELFYQPIVNGDGSRLLGFEALLRLGDTQGGYISPTLFVPIAETRGYIKAIGSWVIREAARQIALWPEPLFVSVNLSAVQFRDGDLVDIVQSTLREAGIPGRRLEIEVVESLLLERSEDVLEQLGQLKDLGISIDMDDFGTGYSSLSYLWRFPFDKLKIDQSFMVALTNGEPNVPQILETIVAMAHTMQMKVTTEGIETDAQVELMKRLGCDQLQGYLFGKPMPAERVASEVLTRFRIGEAESIRPLSSAKAAG
ncbi:EAL domain-containing protein [Aurantimonas endophytica]|uniref:Diguanylate cyclase (GGDEF)-like protein n=1 Tax=Aurantimonas endophytica TaxID=1522175 RepID=A0A7W6H9M6_9HYPH|nr:diguanylate cyclase (GGDEF)-like protein [Aurantimonas endophytica]